MVISQNPSAVKTVIAAESETNLATGALVADHGRIRIGSGCRVRPSVVPPGQTTDSGKIRMGSGCRIRLQRR
jgi:hypothetical protein